MQTKILAIAAVAALLSTPALAGQCPRDMATIDAALADNPALSDAQLAEVRNLRAEGEEAHEAGNHGESVAKLAEAMKILGIAQ